MVIGVGWQPNAWGDVIIHFRVNPSIGSASRLSGGQVVAAIVAAAAAWQAADPHIRLIFDGTTTAHPAENNVFGFLPGAPSGVTNVTHGPGGYFRGRYTTFDVAFDSHIAWSWVPCHPIAGRSCSSYDSFMGGAPGIDLQDVATHEWGHVLGLEHVTEIWDSQLVMWAGGQTTAACPSGSGCRWRDTLGLGDILGVRFLYPTAAPLPVIDTL